MLINFINNYLEKDTSRSNKSNLIKLLISDEEKFNEINSFVNFGTFKQKLYHFVNNLKNQPKCLICNGIVNWVEKDFHYRETCSSKCSGKLNLFRKRKKIKINHPILSTKEQYINYFKSGKIKVTKSCIAKYYPNLVIKINVINFTDDFNTMLYCYLKDINSIPVCKHCEINNVIFDTFSKGFHDYCSVKCSSNSNDKKERIKNTNQIKYGVDNIGEVTRKKALLTMNEKYGSHFSKTIEFKEKFKNTSIENYGVEHPFKSEIVKSKIKNKILQKYNTDHQMKNDDIVKKALNTRANNGHIYKWSEEELKNYETYRRKVTYFSEKNYNTYKDLINPNNLERGHLTYHLDHIYPVILGFINNIDAELIANYKNLQLLSHIDNRSKGGKTDMSIDEFYKIIY